VIAGAKARARGSRLTVTALALATAVASAKPPDRSPAYDPALADQHQFAQLDDTIPGNAEARQVLARALAFDATIYGTAAVLQYRQMYQQAVDRNDPAFTGFNAFAHDRALAGPGYKAFKTPNADTLYSNAWLDLRDGPVLFDVPDTAGRYYTANFLDIHGNATNISARTHGTGGGRFLIATTNWQGDVPEGTTLFRVATPFTWILLRVLVQEAKGDLPRVNALQDRFRLSPVAKGAPSGSFPDGHDQGGAGFMRILDFVLRTCGHPLREDALIYRFGAIGLAGNRKVDDVLADPAMLSGIDRGFADAQAVIKASMGQNGKRVGAWSQPRDVGRYGFNYLYRAAITTLGTGGNVIDENHPATSFVDATGARLDGALGDYRLVLSPPPPARFFWSVTVYDAATRELYPNALNRYMAGDRTPGLKRGTDGSVTILFSHRPEALGISPNILPVPAGPFYVVIRAQGPEAAMRNGEWRAAPIEKLPDAKANPE
jgi:hypothetical protein